MNARPWRVEVLGRRLRVHAATEEDARIAAASLIGIDAVRLDSGNDEADSADNGPTGFLLPDPETDPAIWFDLGELGRWATDGRCAFHESLAWSVQRHVRATKWIPASDDGVADKLISWLAGAWVPIALRADGLRVAGIGAVLEGPGTTAIDAALALPVSEWYAPADPSVRCVAAKRGGRLVSLVALIDPTSVQHARDDRDRMLPRLT